jgi:5-methylcytosine-specific restriction enzyme subunit McrC
MLFEYRNTIPRSDSMEGLEAFLEQIWDKRERSVWHTETDADQSSAQQILQFLYKTSTIKARNYVGVIHFNGNRINILPKIFYQEEHEYQPHEIAAMHNHVLWWLSYCQRIKFPSYVTGLGAQESDFFEVLIYLFAQYTCELLNSSIYQQYIEITEELPYIKGRLEISPYINQNLARGRWHRLNCTHDPYLMDNKFNRIIKCVASLLFSLSGSSESKKYLEEILIILDGVNDYQATADDCLEISFNIYHEAFETVRDYCHLFLSNSIVYAYKNELKLFAFLMPMEYVFEDFLHGFIKREITSTVKYQSSAVRLDTEGHYSLKPDMLLDYKGVKVIADAKYKTMLIDSGDPYKSISQSDLYQVLAYALRFGINDVLLLYPETISQTDTPHLLIKVRDELAQGEDIRIRACRVPIIEEPLCAGQILDKTRLCDIFDKTKNRLKDRLLEILDSVTND